MEAFKNEIAKFAKKLEAAALDNGELQFEQNFFRNLLYSEVDRFSLKSKGAFFTSYDVAAELSGYVCRNGSKVRVLDPACGAGDLLLAHLAHQKVPLSLKEALVVYNQFVLGSDVESVFVECTKLRIIHYALLQGCHWDLDSLEEGKTLLSSITCADALSSDVWKDGYDVVLMNPPYFSLGEYQGDIWGAKRITAAAAFLEKAISHSADGVQILAILPDVLRSGSRYAKLRNLIRQASANLNVRILGRFDHMADVDVFFLDVTRGTGTLAGIGDWAQAELAESALGDYFEVRVGPVVPHRDPVEGNEYPFLSAKTCSPWIELESPTLKRRYLGKTYKGPFVVVRRTSSPSDKKRCVPTVIAGSADYAVENHLIIIKPIDGLLETCRELANYLKRVEVNDWVNQRIRCRHLTVSALKEMPFDKSEVGDGV